jgi:signal transduction histidine kinase
MSERERLRLAALHEYRLLDEPAGDELEAVVRVAAAVAEVPTATLNLIDEHRQCQLTTVGFPGADSAREDSMCAYVFESGQFTHVPDARVDPLFAANPWVTGALGEIRLYASAPLVSPQGHALGSLCIFDSRPGELSRAQVTRLQDLARVVVALFERRRQARVNADLAAETERQRVQLAAAVAELKRSNTELEQLGAVASHDLAAPLAVVGGYIELVQDEYADQLDERGVAWITTALRGVARMRSLIDALLRYAQAGAGACRRDRTATHDLFDQAAGDLGDVISTADARVVAPEPLPVLHADPTLLRQLLQNLIGNAVKYRHPDRPCLVTVTASPTGDGWDFAVADNGPGIPPEHRDRIFDMFAMIEPGRGTGHGIGLATCQRIVSRHGGHIWAAETPGGGATIRFTIPDRPTG